MNSKGITPIISIILLLMMTIAVAGAAFFWLTRIQNQLQGGVESYQATTQIHMASKVEILASNYDGENLTFAVQNIGATKVPISTSADPPTTTWILMNENRAPVCSTNWNGTYVNCTSGCGTDLDVGQVRLINLRLNSTCNISDVAKTSGKGKLYSFTIDFSGKTTGSGSFIY